ncbi:hypothetical protein HYQ45_001072 [Verticillium longisporum]|uniref:Uncharacterized protein n=1 Tax=Verticillium longisporum TaxID=100787 RepID=A0A8I3A0Y3_VERLO|nr:hypothetical protein HYQ45_001072 [Verticillium longisporum]
MLRGKPEDNSLKKMALQYKQKGLETLRHALNGPIRRVTVATGLALALDEMSFGDTKTAIQHCQEVIRKPWSHLSSMIRRKSTTPFRSTISRGFQ